MANRKKRIGWQLLPLNKRLTFAQKKKRIKKINRRKEKYEYQEKKGE